MASQIGNTQSVHRSQVGKIGEDLAEQYLVDKGWKIIQRNFKARYGEIDIVAQDGDTLVFVEVKTRIGNAYGTPEESVTPRKLREVIQTAQYYKVLHPNLSDALRIDVVGIVLDAANNAVISFNHIKSVTS